MASGATQSSSAYVDLNKPLSEIIQDQKKEKALQKRSRVASTLGTAERSGWTVKHRKTSSVDKVIVSSQNNGEFRQKQVSRPKTKQVDLANLKVTVPVASTTNTRKNRSNSQNRSIKSYDVSNIKVLVKPPEKVVSSPKFSSRQKRDTFPLRIEGKPQLRKAPKVIVSNEDNDSRPKTLSERFGKPAAKSVVIVQKR